MSRKAPKESSASLKLDQFKIHDGIVWIVTERSNGTHYWKKTKLAINQLTNKINNVKKQFKMNMPTRTILIGELETELIYEGVCLSIDEDFYNVLRCKPKSIKHASGGNAFIFGPKFSTGYVHVGNHVNDIAQTAILDVTQFTKAEQKTISNTLNNLKLSTRKNLTKAFREVIPRTIFVGITNLGDVGADIYIHFNNDKIDSLIIDSYSGYVL